MRFPYRSEPITQAAILIVVLVAAAVLLPISALRLLLLSIALGAAVWTLLQLRRQQLAIVIEAEVLLIPHGWNGRIRRLQWATIRGVMDNKREGVAIAYERPAPPPITTVPRQLTETHTAKPRNGLIVTPAIENNFLLLSEIQRRAPNATFDTASLTRLIRRRRLRGYVALAFAILGIPLYIYIIMRTIAFIR